MKLFYVSLTVGIASGVCGFAAIVEQAWWVAGVCGAMFATFCALAGRLVKRIPPDQIARNARWGENLVTAIGKAQSGGWNPREPEAKKVSDTSGVRHP